MDKFLVILFCAQVGSIMVGVLIALYDERICLSSKCEDLAAMMRHHVDEDVDPCQDFYQFTCGRLVSDNNTSSQGVVDISNQLQVERLFQLLANQPDNSEPTAFTKTKLVFRRCLGDTESFQHKTAEINKLLRDMGGFPTVEGAKWNDSGWSWVETVKRVKHEGFLVGTNVLLSFTFTVDVFHPPKLVVLLNSPKLVSLSMDSCTSGIDTVECQEAFLNEYLSYAVLLGANKTQAAEDALSALLIELALSLVSARFPSLFGIPVMISEQNIVPLADMNVLYSFVDWPKLLTHIFPQRRLTPDLKIFVGNPNYLNSLKATLESFSKRNLANYIMWNVLKQNIIGTIFNSINLNRNQFCLNFVLGHMEVSMNAMYIAKYPDPRGNDMNIVKEIVTQLRLEIAKSVAKAEWMSSQTKLKSLAKIEYLISRFGDLGILNKTFVDNYYKHLSLEGNAFQVMLRVKRVRQENFLSLLFSSDGFLASLLYEVPLYLANAAYLPLDNSINILQGILQRPIFEAGWPAYVNYGRLGSVVGHEMTHALDYNGHWYDHSGTLRDTWDNLTYAMFAETGRCLVDQFNHFYNTSLLQMRRHPAFSGRYKLTENMADTGGLRLALRAYRNHARDHNHWPDLLLPNFNYNQEQMFFISYALFWCSKMATKRRFLLDSHAPNEYRVISSLHNNPYFKEVFHCDADSRMVSGKKCNVW